MAFCPRGSEHRVRCVSDPDVTVEDVLVGIGERIGCENIASASGMNKAVVVFVIVNLESMKHF